MTRMPKSGGLIGPRTQDRKIRLRRIRLSRSNKHGNACKRSLPPLPRIFRKRTAPNHSSTLSAAPTCSTSSTPRPTSPATNSVSPALFEPLKTRTSISPGAIDVLVFSGSNKAGDIEFVAGEVGRGVEEVEQVGAAESVLEWFGAVLFRKIRGSGGSERLQAFPCLLDLLRRIRRSRIFLS